MQNFRENREKLPFPFFRQLSPHVAIFLGRLFSAARQEMLSATPTSIDIRPIKKCEDCHFKESAFLCPTLD
jgi:hypothetical protein